MIDWPGWVFPRKVEKQGLNFRANAPLTLKINIFSMD